MFARQTVAEKPLYVCLIYIYIYTHVSMCMCVCDHMSMRKAQKEIAQVANTEYLRVVKGT